LEERIKNKVKEELNGLDQAEALKITKVVSDNIDAILKNEVDENY
jgi:hypothetical protein